MKTERSYDIYAYISWTLDIITNLMHDYVFRQIYGSITILSHKYVFRISHNLLDCKAYVYVWNNT